MPIVPDRRRARFTLAGADFEPTGPEWRAAAPGDKAAYFRQLAVLARDAKFAELRKSIDIRGNRMRPRKRPRRDGATGPVLVPHWSESRAVTQLRWQGTAAGAVLWWTSRWAPAVRGWAELHGRDVIGLTDASKAKITASAREWWAARVAAGRMGRQAVTTLGLRPTGTEGVTVWSTGKVPSRPRDSIFAPPTLPLPTRPIKPRQPAYQLARRVSEVLDAAAGRKIQRGEIEVFAAQFRRVPLDNLREVLRRIGVTEPAPDRDRALLLLRRNLLQRWVEGRSGWQGFGPGGPPPRPRPPAPAPKPKPVDRGLMPGGTIPLKPRDDAPPEDYRSLGVTFTAPVRAKGRDYVTVLADVAKLDAAWQADPGFRVGFGGGGDSAVAGRYDEFGRFLERARREGIAVEMPEPHLTAAGVGFTNGRHRFAWLRDHGIRYLPVRVERAEAARFRERFGYSGAI